MINQGQARLCMNFGAMMQVLLSTERRTFKLVSIAVQTMTAVKLNQVCVMFNQRGEPSGYALWAFLSDEVAAEMTSNPDRILHYSEWNEGLNLWILDFVAPAGQVRELAHKLRDEVLKDFKRVHGVRTRADGSIRKLVNVSVRRAAGSKATKAYRSAAPSPAATRIPIRRGSVTPARQSCRP